MRVQGFRFKVQGFGFQGFPVVPRLNPVWDSGTIDTHIHTYLPTYLPTYIPTYYPPAYLHVPAYIRLIPLYVHIYIYIEREREREQQNLDTSPKSIILHALSVEVTFRDWGFRARRIQQPPLVGVCVGPMSGCYLGSIECTWGGIYAGSSAWSLRCKDPGIGFQDLSALEYHLFLHTTIWDKMD